MASSKHRITKEREIGKLYRTGRSVSGQYFYIKTSLNQLDHPRYTVVVSKKVSKLANKRNTARRRLTAAADETLSSWKKMDVIFYLKSTLEEVAFEQLKKEISQLLKKAGVL